MESLNNHFLGQFASSVNISTHYLTKYGALSGKKIMNGFIWELRNNWKLKSDAETAKCIMKLQPREYKGNIHNNVRRKINSLVHKVHEYKMTRDPRLDTFLHQIFEPPFSNKNTLDLADEDMESSESDSCLHISQQNSLPSSPVHTEQNFEELEQNDCHSFESSVLGRRNKINKDKENSMESQISNNSTCVYERAKQMISAANNSCTANQNDININNWASSSSGNSVCKAVTSDEPPTKIEKLDSTSSEMKMSYNLPEKASMAIRNIGKDKWEQGEASSLEMYPPDVTIPITELNQLFVCFLCGCYIFKATTVVECMHTFCRKCIYYHIERSKKCPYCNELLDQSNPISSLREDRTLQELMNKMLANVAKEEKQQEENFYQKRGMDFPSSGHTPNEKKKSMNPKMVKRWISLKLEFIGCNEKEVPPVNELKKNIVLLPLQTSVRHIQKYIAVKLPLNDYLQALILHNDHLLHEDLTMEEMMLLFYPEIEISDTGSMTKYPIAIQYAVVPKGRDYFYMLSVDDNSEEELSPPPKIKKKESLNQTIDHGRGNKHDECSQDNLTPSKVPKTESNNNDEKKQSYTCASCGSVTLNLPCHIRQNHADLSPNEKTELRKNSEQYISENGNQYETQKLHSETTCVGKICSICHRVQINIYQHFNIVHKHLTIEERKEAIERNVIVLVKSVGDSEEHLSNQPRYCCKCNMLQLDVEKHVREKHKTAIAKQGFSAIIKKCPYVFLKSDKASIEPLLEYIHH